MKLSITIYAVFGLLALLLCTCTSTQSNTAQISNSTNAAAQNGNSTPASATPVPSGFVEDEQAAIDIAVKVWIPIYGQEHIESEKPYEAKLKNGIWEVSGSLQVQAK
ncbi:MAG: hypothetical protein IT173_11075 [Acidobacteria bacterium]|nr:hypothetical protein [Acidobacteriota bacterium]